MIKKFPVTEWAFEYRNKEYGAYQLRSSYTKFLFVSLCITLVVGLGGVLFWYFAQKSTKETQIEDAIYIDLEKYTPTKDELLPIQENKQQVVPPKKNIPIAQKTEIPKNAPPEVAQKKQKDSTQNSEKIKNDTTKSDHTTSKVDSLKNTSKKDVLADSLQKKPLDGFDAFKTYINEQKRYPSQAILENKECIVFVTFYINEDGTSTIRNVNGCEDYFEDEVRRLFADAPRWLPIFKDGVAIRKVFKVDIKFKIKDLQRK